MARKAKPWWWEARQGYYATVRGTCHRLGTSLRAAETKLGKLLKEQPEERRTASGTTVADVLQAFLDWTKQNRSPKTHRGYFDFCESFNVRHPDLLMDDLSPDHVTTWLGEKTTWNSTTRRGAITALQRAMNWARKNKGLKENPIAGMEKPTARTRTTVVSPDEFIGILAAIKDEPFKELLQFSYDCGCRPQEAKALEARHVDLAKQRCVLPTAEAKGRKAPRSIYLATADALAIVERRVKEFPDGKLFRNARGRPWTASAVKCRFARLEEKLGKRYSQYALRHTWVTRKLVAGVDSHVVAALAGHSDSSMIDRVYSHVADDHRFMLAAAKQGA